MISLSFEALCLASSMSCAPLIRRYYKLIIIFSLFPITLSRFPTVLEACIIGTSTSLSSTIFSVHSFSWGCATRSLMRDAPLLYAIHILYFIVKQELGRWISISKEGKSVKSRYCMQSEMNNSLPLFSASIPSCFYSLLVMYSCANSPHLSCPSLISPFLGTCLTSEPTRALLLSSLTTMRWVYSHEI